MGPYNIWAIDRKMSQFWKNSAGNFQAIGYWAQIWEIWELTAMQWLNSFEVKSNLLVLVSIWNAPLLLCNTLESFSLSFYELNRFQCWRIMKEIFDTTLWHWMNFDVVTLKFFLKVNQYFNVFLTQHNKSSKSQIKTQIMELHLITFSGGILEAVSTTKVSFMIRTFFNIFLIILHVILVYPLMYGSRGEGNLNCECGYFKNDFDVNFRSLVEAPFEAALSVCPITKIKNHFFTFPHGCRTRKQF